MQNFSDKMKLHHTAFTPAVALALLKLCAPAGSPRNGDGSVCTFPYCCFLEGGELCALAKLHHQIMTQLSVLEVSAGLFQQGIGAMSLGAVFWLHYIPQSNPSN